MVQKRYFTENVCVYRDDVAYSVQTEKEAFHNEIIRIMNEHHIPINGESLSIIPTDGSNVDPRNSEAVENIKGTHTYYIGILKRSDAKKLINLLMNVEWAYLHIDLN